MENGEKVTLNDLINETKEETTTVSNTTESTPQKAEYEKVNISDIAPIKVKEDPATQFIKEEIEAINISLERNKKEMLENVINPAKEAYLANKLSDELDSEEKSLGNAIDDSLDIVNKALSQQSEVDVEYEKELAKAAAIEEEIKRIKESKNVEAKKQYAADDLPSDEDVIKATTLPESVLLKDTPKLEPIKIDINKPKEEVIEEPVITETEEKNEQDEDDSLSEIIQDIDDNIENVFDEDDIQLSKEEREKLVNNLKQTIKSKLNIVDRKVDFSSYTIKKKPVVINEVKLSNKDTELKFADTPLLYKNTVITLSEFKGSEIVKLNLDEQYKSQNKINAIITMFKTIYKHVIDSKKPKFEAWLKSIPVFDMQLLYWAIYRACFKDSNYLVYNCDKCKNLDLAEKDINEMIECSEEVRSKIDKLMKESQLNDKSSTYETTLVPIDDTYAIEFVVPSIWSYMVENNILDDEFIEKYKTIINIAPFIDNIYVIDKENHELIPIDLMPDPNNAAKTVRNKVRIYSKFIDNLSDEAYTIVINEIAKINASAYDIAIGFKIPEIKCSKCGAIIPAQPTGPLSMLFSRHQLVAIAIS